MKKAYSLLILCLLCCVLFAPTVSAERDLLEEYRIWREYGDDSYAAYQGGHREGYSKGYSNGKSNCEFNTHPALEQEAQERGEFLGKQETEEKYQNYVPWWVTLITGGITAVVCIGGTSLVFLLLRKKKDCHIPKNPFEEVSA